MIANLKHQKFTGFTIIELLVVVVVIGILASITVVSYRGVQERAKVATVQLELRSIGQEASMVVIDKGTIVESDWADILDRTGLYEATRDSTKKNFVFCWSHDDFAIVALRPLIDSSQPIADGTEVWTYHDSGVSTINWDSSVAGPQTQARACNQVLPGYVNSQWSSFV